MGIKIIDKNKRAFFDYFIQETYEAGICLLGTEIKSLREGKGKIGDAFVAIDKGNQAWIYNMHVAHYDFGNRNNHEETRKRKLLLHKKEIAEIKAKTQREGLAVIPLKLYFKKSLVKIEIALAKGKKKFDKRESIKAQEAKKRMQNFTF